MSRKHLKIGLSILAIITVIIAIFTLGILSSHEKPLADINKHEKINIIGNYSINGQEKKQIPSNYEFNLKGTTEMVVNGYFDRDISINQQLIMRIDNLEVKMYINDKLIYSVGDKKDLPKMVQSPGNFWDCIISKGISKNDNVKIIIKNKYNNHVNVAFNSFFDKMYFGYENTLIINNVSASIINSNFSVFIICLGLIIFALSAVLIKMKRPALPTLIFGFLSIFSGLWFTIDFNIQGYYFPYPISNNAVDIISLALTGALVALYFGVCVKNKFRYVLFGGASIWFLLIIVSSLCQLFTSLDYYNFTNIIAILAVLTAIILIISLVIEWIKYRTKQTNLLALSTLFICVGIIADVICNVFEFLPYVLWFKIGFVIFLGLQFFEIIRYVSEVIKDNARINVLKRQSKDLEKAVEYQKLINEATEGLYDNIYEIDLTNNRLVGDATVQYFESAGISGNTPFDIAIKQLAEKQIKKEYQQEYINRFTTKNAIKNYYNGQRKSSYEYQITQDGKTYFWMRITVRIFYLENDKSLRMIVFRQNINDEKQHEKLFQYQQLMTEVTKGLYESIYEFNLSKQKIWSESTKHFCEVLGANGEVTYDEFINLVINKQVKEEYRQGYVDTFNCDKLLEDYEKGIDHVSYELMMTYNGQDYFWMRITGRLFFWNDDLSVHMITYRENIDEGKKRELVLFEQTKQDPLTNLYNKSATEKLIIENLEDEDDKTQLAAFFIIDIDDFKIINDTFGHSVRDLVIKKFANQLKSQFRKNDIVGRIGGDEFVVFIRFSNLNWLNKKAERLRKSLNKKATVEDNQCKFSSSIGIAIAPEHGTDFETLYKNADKALYQTKENGKNGYTIYQK